MKRGGISRYTFEILKQAVLCKQLDVSLFAGAYWTDRKIEQFSNDCISYWGIRRPSFMQPVKMLGVLNRILFAGYRRNKSFDVYHPTLYLDLYPKFKGKRVYTVHDLLGFYFPDNKGLAISAELIKRAVPKVSKILAVSNRTKMDLIELLKVPEDKIKVTPIANSLKIKVNEERLIKSDYILHVSGIGSHKNFRTLLKAYAGSSFLRSNFKLVKFGISKMNKEEQEFVKKNNIADRVIFLVGSDSVLANLYNYAAAFAFPSLYEGFGIPPLEAMYYGCPAVVSNRASIPEVVGDAGLYFNPEDEEELMNKLETVLTDSELRNHLIQKGYEQEKKFSWVKCFKQTLEAYLG